MAAASLSAYWVKFFKGAGFPQDVATKHAVVFSNNRIKPDMLPDLDKPSLKEMGITLMGDMIAILRYAKKVVEETTCERFLVDSEDTPLPCKVSTKPVVKKMVEDGGNKTVLPTASKTTSIKKMVKPLSVMGKKVATVKKPISVQNSTATVNQKQTAIKRKLRSEESYVDNEDNWSIVGKKRVKTADDDDGNEDAVEYAVAAKVSSARTRVVKKPVEQKRTVFDRLGDSSVTSTTNLIDTTPTFNVTGVGKDVFKRSSSVFKRLGDIDDKKDHATVRILKNGSNATGSPGILKNRISPSVRTSIVTTKRTVAKTTGTMHADHEASKKTFNNASRILKLAKETVSDSSPASERIVKPVVTSGKLASERLVPIPAKARLGTTTAKQVTFSKVAIVTHVKKADVFSRLGV
ncbi:hypothetical protein DMN91_001736 [Ooceraea biroi]|uniref:SAM domain-containing protein n=1 Tax=Ooceraea biroi TaxID=2015173 RepID=A0A026WIF9_OOCBI|nr:uncharacterized protein C19orf47 [Ooceraea biroi]EZA55446.1 hypothetical protein X777_04407 [Ooceraea biroi]RLU25579.1 hypothetical protein DMN91_001736 [Ooceraea biroi]